MSGSILKEIAGNGFKNPSYDNDRLQCPIRVGTECLIAVQRGLIETFCGNKELSDHGRFSDREETVIGIETRCYTASSDWAKIDSERSMERTRKLPSLPVSVARAISDFLGNGRS